MRDAKDPTSGAEKEVVLAHPGLDRKVGVGGLRTVSVKARDEFSEFMVSFAHAISWAIADGLPPCSRVPPAKCRPPRVQECTQRARGGRGLNGKQARRDRYAPLDARQGSRTICRPASMTMRRGGRTFELWQREGSSRGGCCPPSCVKKPKFLHGFAPRGTRSV